MGTRADTEPRWPMIQLNLDGTALDVRADLKTLTAMRGKPQVGVQSAFSVDPHARLAWHELDKLALDALSYCGTDPGIEDYLAERRSITKLVLTGYERGRLGKTGLVARLVRKDFYTNVEVVSAPLLTGVMCAGWVWARSAGFIAPARPVHELCTFAIGFVRGGLKCNTYRLLITLRSVLG